MNYTSRLLLVLLSTAIVSPLAADSQSQRAQSENLNSKNKEKTALSAEEISKLHWVGLLTGLWLTKACGSYALGGIQCTLMPDQMANSALPMPSEASAKIQEKRALLAKGVMISGIVFSLIGIPATFASAKLTWFFAKKKLQRDGAQD